MNMEMKLIVKRLNQEMNVSGIIMLVQIELVIKLIRFILLMMNVNLIIRIVLLMERDVLKLINVLLILIDQDVLLIKIINHVHFNLVVIYNNVVMLLNLIQQMNNVKHIKKNVQLMEMDVL